MANTNDGWIKAWRKLSTNKIWLEKPFSKGQAWIDLLMFATQTTHTSVRNGVDVTYEAGYVYESVAGLSDRWGWSRPRVYRFLDQLKNDGMIDYQRRTRIRTSNVTPCVTHPVTPLRIVNWELYQDRRTVSVTQNRTSNRTSNVTHPKNNIYPKNDISKEVYICYASNSPTGYPFPCGLYEKPEWMTEEEWEESKSMTVEDIPGVYRGEYESVIDYLLDKKKGCLE